MSSPNTSASQTDNCRDSKAISLSQPITSLPTPEGDGRPEPTAPDRITEQRWHHTWAPAQQENFGCTRISVRDVNSQGLGFLTLPEDLESSLQYGNTRFTQQLTLAMPMTPAGPGLCYGLCLSALPAARQKAFQHSKPRPHPQARTVGIT